MNRRNESGMLPARIFTTDRLTDQTGQDAQSDEQAGGECKGTPGSRKTQRRITVEMLANLRLGVCFNVQLYAFW